MTKLTEWLTEPFLGELKEDVNLPIKVGDIVKMGRFKNKTVVVKSIDWNEKGDLLINGRPALKFRLEPKKKEQIKEGVNDPGILKAVFLAGGPGSGKTFVAQGLFGIPKKINVSAKGLKLVNQDAELEAFLKRYGFGTDLDNMPDDLFRQLTDPSYKDYSGLRGRTKELSQKKLELYKKGRLGVIIDGTGHKFNAIKKQKTELEKIGYDTYMVFVHTDLDVAQKRNAERPRKLPPELVEKSWKEVQANLGAFQGLFGGSNFLIVDNSKVLDEEQAKKRFKMLVKKGIGKFVRKPVKNKIGKKWIEKQKLLKRNEVKEIEVPSPSRERVKKNKTNSMSGYKNITEEKQIKKVIGVYPGRFQPFGPHHKKVYEWMKKQFDDVYITTSDIKKPPKHPLNFKEKARHMIKMGIPKNKIIKERVPYVAINTLSKFDKDTTAVIYVVGSKDAGRLKGGVKKSGGLTYYQDYKKNKNNLKGLEDHGYTLIAPHISIKSAGMEVSGTAMRQLLGSPKYADDRERRFKKFFGYFDKGVYNMITNKFSKLFGERVDIPKELIEEFLIDVNISKIIKEESATTGAPVDDGPPTFYRGFRDYKKQSKKWMDSLYVDKGWEVVQYILGKHAINPDYDYTLKYNIVPVVSYGTTGTGKKYNNPLDKYKKHIETKVLKNLGYEIIKWMGLTDTEKDTEGAAVEAPVAAGADGEVENTELKERINLDEEIGLLIRDMQNSDEIADDRILLLCGGAAGHMNHPFDDKNLTFSDLKQIIINGLGGKLDREDNVTEKLDGQNLMVSWVNGKLVTARNKGQLKNFGSAAMDIKGVASKFAGRGDIRDAFVFAMKDLNKAISSLSDKQREKIFGNGKRWMNLEVIYPASANVIDYDKAQIVFHGTLEYDERGTAIGQPKDSARILAGMIKQTNQDIQKHFKIGKPQFLQVPKVQDFGKKKNGYLNRLKKLQKQFNLKDNDTLAMYHQRYWEEFIFNASKQMKYKIPNKILVNLTKRWAFFDKSYKIQKIKKDIDNKKFLDWVLSFDKKDHSKWVKQNMKPFEILFFDVGAEILKNISGFLAVNPDKAVQKIRKDVIAAISKVKKGGDIKKIETLKHQLDKLNKIGGMSGIVPSEGIVFKYKGNTYKFTGKFASINQILGLLTF